MRRVRLEEAFRDAAPRSPEGEAPIAEALVLDVRGGQVVAVVPPGTPDDRVISAASSLRAAIRLDNERVLVFEIHEGASSASFRDEVARLHAAQLTTATGPSGPEGPVDTAALGTVDRIMTARVLTASPDELVEDVAKRLAFHNVTGLPVEDWDGRVIGIVSEMDVIGKIGDTIRDVMTGDVVAVSPDTPVQHAAALMAERGIKRLPVLADGKLVGILSRADIVRALAGRAAGS